MGKKNHKVSANPPKKSGISDEQKVALSKSFVKDGALFEPTNETKTIIIYPWENARDDMQKTFNLRLSEEYAIKLDYIAMQTKSSKHSICMKVIKEEIDRLLLALTNNH